MTEQKKPLTWKKYSKRQQQMMRDGICGRKRNKWRQLPKEKRYCTLPSPDPSRMHPCHHHGGKSLRGPASPSWKHGLRSECLPAQMLADFERVVRDPARYAYDRNLGVGVALLQEALERSAEPGPDWSAAVKSYKEIRKAIRSGAEPHQVADMLDELEAILDAGGNVERRRSGARKEVHDLLAEVRRTTASEHLRRHRESVAVAVQDLVALRAREVDIIAQCLAEHVPEDQAAKVVTAIIDAFRREAVRVRYSGGETALLGDGTESEVN